MLASRFCSCKLSRGSPFQPALLQTSLPLFPSLFLAAQSLCALLLRSARFLSARSCLDSLLVAAHLARYYAFGVSELTAAFVNVVAVGIESINVAAAGIDVSSFLVSTAGVDVVVPGVLGFANFVILFYCRFYCRFYWIFKV